MPDLTEGIENATGEARFAACSALPHKMARAAVTYAMTPARTRPSDFSEVCAPARLRSGRLDATLSVQEVTARPYRHRRFGHFMSLRSASHHWCKERLDASDVGVGCSELTRSMQISSNLLACEQPSSRPPPPPPPLEMPPNVPQKEFKKNPPGVTPTGKRKRDTLPKCGDRVKVHSCLAWVRYGPLVERHFARPSVWPA